MNSFFERTGWILTALVALFIVAACAAAGDGQDEGQATATPVSAIENLPLPTGRPDEILVVVVTPTPPAEGEEAAATEQPAAAGEATEETAEPTGEATEQQAAEGEAAEGAAEPTGEATEQPAAEQTATVEPTGEATEQPSEGEGTEGTAEPTGEATEQPSEGDEMVAVSDEELINQGEQIYASQCAKCHQFNGRGMGSAFPALRGSEMVIAEDPSAAIATVLLGPEAMPSFQGILSEQEIAAVVSYIRTAWNNDASLVSVEQVQETQDVAGAEAQGR